MARKIFISFLGTNNYVPCNYYDEGDERNKVLNIKFVQEATIQLYCTDFSSNDKFYFFLTEEAKKMNWNSDGQYNKITNNYDAPNEGLKVTLDKLNLPSNPIPIDINQGFTEKEIWDIFEIVTQLIDDDDELILDITHAFRSLPMLAMVLTNYLKTTKNIKVKAILYGAFEVLGPAFKVKHRPMEERNAPITNLLSFSKLQDWSMAANMFTQTGRASSLKEISSDEIKLLLRSSKGQDPFASKIREVGKNLAEFTDAITTNRGKRIYHAKEIIKLRKDFNELKEMENVDNKYKPFLSLVENAIQEFSKIKEDSTDNWFYVSKWCLKNLLVQQGITIFREGIVTQVLNFINTEYNRNLNYDSIDDRELCEAFMYSSQPNIKIEDYKKIVLQNFDLFNNIKSNTRFLDIAKLYNSSLDLRNDINHSGYGEENNRKPSVFYRKLESLIQDFEKKSTQKETI